MYGMVNKALQERIVQRQGEETWNSVREVEHVSSKMSCTCNLVNCAKNLACPRRLLSQIPPSRAYGVSSDSCVTM